MNLLCLEAYVTLSQTEMTTLIVDNRFVGKMPLISISGQHQTAWLVVIPGKILYLIEKSLSLSLSPKKLFRIGLTLPYYCSVRMM